MVIVAVTVSITLIISDDEDDDSSHRNNCDRDRHMANLISRCEFENEGEDCNVVPPTNHFSGECCRKYINSRRGGDRDNQMIFGEIRKMTVGAKTVKSSVD